MDFIVEWPDLVNCLNCKAVEWWILYVDRVFHDANTRIGLVLQSLIGKCFEQAVRLSFHTLNNEAKYEALLVRVKLALSVQANHLDIWSDSQLVVNQV